MHSEWAPPVRTFETSLHTPPLPVTSRVGPERVHTPSREHHTASPPRDLDERETIHPIPILPVSRYDIVNKRPESALRNEIYVGRARSESRPSRESISRIERPDQERHHSSRTEAESIIEQWRVDDDSSPPPPRDPPRSFTPFAVPQPRPPNIYYRPWEIVTPPPLGDVDDPRSRRHVPTESAAAIRKTRKPEPPLKYV
ncbi:hypothetical protein OG21DRAFT_1483887 [Imleria badia]|nr:hypothetical protein OG21DRAFT_1483887 [Imleria badia]